MTELAVLDAEIEGLEQEAAALTERLGELKGMIKGLQLYRSKISPRAATASVRLPDYGPAPDMPSPRKVPSRSAGNYGVNTGKILKCLSNGNAWHISQIEEATGLSNVQVRNSLKGLKKQKRIEQAGAGGSGNYRITAKGLLSK